MITAIMAPTATPTPIPAFAPVERLLFEGGTLDRFVFVAVGGLVSVLVLVWEGVGDEAGVMKSADCHRIEMAFAFMPNVPFWLDTAPSKVYV